MIEKINRLLKAPQVLLEKPLMAGVIGIAFLAIGILSLIFMKDLLFFFMSLFIAAYCVYICLQLLHRLIDKEYTALEGKCTERIQTPFSGYVRITFDVAEEGTVVCRLRKKTAESIMQGKSYCIYFIGSQETNRSMNQSRFWALEEL